MPWISRPGVKLQRSAGGRSAASRATRSITGRRPPEHALPFELAHGQKPERGAHEERGGRVEQRGRRGLRLPAERARRHAEGHRVVAGRAPRSTSSRYAARRGSRMSAAATRSVWRPICRLASRNSRTGFMASRASSRRRRPPGRRAPSGPQRRPRRGGVAGPRRALELGQRGTRSSPARSRTIPAWQ